VRAFALEAGTNRLRRVDVGGDGLDYAFDANGNLRTESGVRHFDWGHGDRLAAFRTQTVGVEPSVHAHYLRDAAGRRVKKLVRRQGGGIEVTDYVDGIFEHRRWRGPSATGAQDVVHVRDDDRRLAVVRLGPSHPDERGPAIQIHLADHLGSSHVVVDGRGGLFNREDYTPFGETSFGAFARKRYRFGGKERDDESGLGDHGARAYAPWLARWVSVDPDASQFPAWSPYCFAFDNPLRFTDPSGRGPVDDLARDVRELGAKVGDVSADLAGAEAKVDAKPGAKPGRGDRRTIGQLESKGQVLDAQGKDLDWRLRRLRQATAGDQVAARRLEGIARDLQGTRDINTGILERTQRRLRPSVPKATARFTDSSQGKPGGGKTTPLLPPGGPPKPPKPPGGKALGVVGGALGAADVINDINRGHYVQGGAKGATYLMSLRASTPYTLALSIAWGAYEHKDDPDIKREAHKQADRVTEYTGSKPLGGLVAAKITVELAVAAAVTDTAQAMFESSFAGQVYNLLR
jgi:RHS repeat-associated protein